MGKLEQDSGWQGDPPPELPLFEGVEDVVAVIRELVTRPTRKKRSDQPILCTFGPEPVPSSLLRGVDEGLRRGGYPRSLLDLDARGEQRDPDAYQAVADSGQKDTLRVADILLGAARDLEVPTSTAGRLRFPRLHLVAHLLRIRFAEDAVEPRRRERDLRVAIRHRGRPPALQPPTTVPEQPSTAWAWLTLLLFGVPYLVFRARASGRFGGVHGWFLRQPYLTPPAPTSFLGFARQLADGEWRKESQVQVRRLLVNAFLADLRRAYRPSWRRPWGRRRMAQPVIFLDRVSEDNGADRLLATINDVRNGIGKRDPLLVVTAGRLLPAMRRPDGSTRSVPAGEIRRGLLEWREDHPADRRLRGPGAWFLGVEVAKPLPAEQHDAARRALRRMRGPAPTAPLWSRQPTKVAAAAVVFAVGVLVYLDWSEAHCGLWWPGLSPELTTIGDQCVGTTDGTYDFSAGGDPTFTEVRSAILRQNEEVADRRARGSTRPFLTVVYLSDLTVSADGGRMSTDKREELAGVAVAQRRQLDMPGQDAPLLRIVIGNAGPRMGAGEAVARQIGDMAHEDPSIVGVTGLSESRVPTVATVRALAREGLPVVAATLSADSLADENVAFYQVAPQNRREAAVAAGWASDLRDRAVPGPNGRPMSSRARIIATSDPGDTYGMNLAADLVASLRSRGFDPQILPYGPAPQVSARAAGQASCDGYDGVVVYAGRGIPDFADFLAGVEQCQQPWILAGDDVTRYVADTRLRQAQRAVSYSTLSFAVAPPPTPEAGDRVDVNFYGTLRALFSYEQGFDDRSLDGHAALSYDAVRTFVTAVQYLREDGQQVPVTAGTTWQKINDIYSPPAAAGSAARALQGATGRIDFGGDVRRRVPKDKPVLVVDVRRGEVQGGSIVTCGALGTTPTPQPVWCPPPESGVR